MKNKLIENFVKKQISLVFYKIAWEWKMNNEKGNLAAGMVLTVIAILSGMVLSILVMGDRVSLDNNAESMQTAHLLRTSLDRGSIILKHIDDFEDAEGIFERKIVTNKSENKIFTLKSEIRLTGNGEDTPDFNICSFVEANNGRRTRYQDINPSAKYAEQIYEVENLADFLIFIDQNVSPNDDPIYFWGRDEIHYGHIHLNTNLYIRDQIAGFPQFGGLVTCSGEILYEDGNAVPLDDPDLFPGGVFANIPVKVLPERAEKIRDNSIWIDCNQELTYIEVRDHNYYTCTAQINDLPPETFTVYNLYPPYGPVGDSLFSNQIVLKDTVWTIPSLHTINDESVFVNSDLWIRGHFGGKQTWGCSGDMYLVGDIKLENTVLGEAPDGYRPDDNDFNGNINTTDYVGLVSERRIIIKYVYSNPIDTILHWDNCGDEVDMDSGIYIYAALAALGTGDCWEDGYFSYEYQYPHPSTPHTYDWMNTDEHFLYPDLHLGRYPVENSTHQWPWPANGGGGFNYPNTWQGMPWRIAGAPDYPWYNPAYPSQVVKYERGFIHLFGSLAQRRRGFIHRSGSDIDNGYWDLDDPAHPFFGPSTPSTGYNKIYIYDSRFLTNPPVNFPEVKSKAGGRIFNKHRVKHKPVPGTV